MAATAGAKGARIGVPFDQRCILTDSEIQARESQISDLAQQTFSTHSETKFPPMPYAQVYSRKQSGTQVKILTNLSGVCAILFCCRFKSDKGFHEKGHEPIALGASKGYYYAYEKTGRILAVCKGRAKLENLKTVRKEYLRLSKFSSLPIRGTFVWKPSKRASEASYYWLERKMEGNVLIALHKGYLNVRQEGCRLAIAEQAARAGATVHAAGLIHRDFKFDNLVYDFRSERLQVLLIDYGLTVRSKRLAHPTGTCAYFSPELFHSAIIAEDYLSIPSEKHDCWAFGISLFYNYFHHLDRNFLKANLRLLSLAGLYSVKAQDVILTQLRQSFFERNLEKEWIVPPKNPKSIEQLIYHLLAFDPEKRWSFQQAVDFLVELRKERFPLSS